MPVIMEITEKNAKNFLLIAFLIISVYLTACNRSESFSFESEHQEYEDSDYDEPIPIGTFIDLYAGHPYDPDLPNEVYGVVDDELEEIHPRDLQRLLDEGLDFAYENIGEPRYLFAIGRAAYLINHHQTKELLEAATNAGSSAASAYLGYYLFDHGFIDEALESMGSAWNSGFQDPFLKGMAKLTRESIFDPELFNRPDFIRGLYHKDLTALKQAGLDGGHYIGAMQNVLWQSDILFLVDDPNILLDLSPKISVKEGYLVRKAQNSWLGGVFLVAEQGIQDARRLAMLYENNPRAFKQVYEGMLAYSRGQ